MDTPNSLARAQPGETDPNWDRPLGVVEKIFANLHELGSMLGISVAVVEGPVTPEIVQAAMDRVQMRQPLLQAHIRDLHGRPGLQRQGTPPASVCVRETQREDQWIEVAEDELRHTFVAEQGPLWRVTLVRPVAGGAASELVLTCHHTIGDGISHPGLVGEILSACQAIACGRSERAPARPPHLLPAVDDMLDKTSTFKEKLKYISFNVKQALAPSALVIEGQAPAHERRTCMIPRRLEPDDTARLRDRCKREGATMQGALSAAMLLAAARILGRRGPVRLTCGNSVNLRRLCRPVVDDLCIGCLAAKMDTTHTVDRGMTFWDLARECAAQARQSLFFKIPQNGIWFFEFTRVYEHPRVHQALFALAARQNAGRTNAVDVSNLGPVALSEHYGPFKLKGLYVATGIHVIGPCLWLGAVAIGGTMFCNFTYVSPVVSSATANVCAEDVMSTLSRAGER